MPSATPSPTPQEGLEESAYPTPGIPLTATTSYTDTVVGYVVDYPADWYIQGQPGGVAVLTSYDVGQVSGHGGIISGTAKMDIVPQALSSGQTLEDLVAGGTSEAQRVQSLEQVRLRSGLRAVRLEYDVEQVQNLHVLITMINGYSVRIYSYGDQRFFDAIAGSLRPTR